MHGQNHIKDEGMMYISFKITLICATLFASSVYCLAV